MSRQQKVVRKGALQVKRGKKLTTLMWNQKKSVTWQSLKSCTCTFIRQALQCASLSLLFFCFNPFLAFACAVAWGVVIFSSFSPHSALCVCVNCGHPLRKGGGAVRAAEPASLVGLSMEL